MRTINPQEWKKQFGDVNSTNVKPRIKEVVNCIDGGRVLHVGCVGGGPVVDRENWLHGHLSIHADEVVGVDIDETAINQLAESNWNVQLDDAEKLEYVDGPFDFVVAGEVIEHLSNPGKMLNSVDKKLDDDGRLLLTTPNVWSVVYFRRLISGSNPVGNEEHTCWFDKNTLLELTNRHGYEAEISLLQPSEPGIASVLYRLNRELGGTRLFADLSSKKEKV